MTEFIAEQPALLNHPAVEDVLKLLKQKQSEIDGITNSSKNGGSGDPGGGSGDGGPGGGRGPRGESSPGGGSGPSGESGSGGGSGPGGRSGPGGGGDPVDGGGDSDDSENSDKKTKMTTVTMNLPPPAFYKEGQEIENFNSAVDLYFTNVKNSEEDKRTVHLYLLGTSAKKLESVVTASDFQKKSYDELKVLAKETIGIQTYKVPP